MCRLAQNVFFIIMQGKRKIIASIWYQEIPAKKIQRHSLKWHSRTWHVCGQLSCRIKPEGEPQGKNSLNYAKKIGNKPKESLCHNKSTFQHFHTTDWCIDEKINKIKAFLRTRCTFLRNAFKRLLGKKINNKSNYSPSFLTEISQQHPLRSGLTRDTARAAGLGSTGWVRRGHHWHNSHCREASLPPHQQYQ